MIAVVRLAFVLIGCQYRAAVFLCLATISAIWWRSVAEQGGRQGFLGRLLGFFAARSLAAGLIGGSTSVTAAGIGIG